MPQKLINKALLVDDTLINISFLEVFFQHHNVEVRQAMAASGVYDIIKTETFDISLIDYHMPGVNGLELLKELQDKKQLAKLGKIYILTADVELSLQQTGMTDIIEDCLYKPIDVEKFEKTLFSNGKNEK